MLLRLLFLSFLLAFAQASAIDKPITQLKTLSPKDSLGRQLSLDLEFSNSEGQKVLLSSFFTDERPVIIVPGYFSCPRLCGLVYGGVAKLVENLTLEPGKDYQVLSVSFDETETTVRAKTREDEYRQKSTKSGSFWHFLHADTPQIAKLMAELGFEYLRDNGEFAHAAAIYVVTPEGIVSQYFSGVQFSRFDLRLALVEASEGRVGNFLDQALLYCFGFDHVKGKYAWVVSATLKIAGVLIILLVGGFLLFLWSKEKRS